MSLEPDSRLAWIPEIKWLRRTISERALTKGDYVLSGGVRSDYYIDKFRLFSDPYVVRRIARMFSPIVAEWAPDVIGGTELGGVILAGARDILDKTEVGHLTAPETTPQGIELFALCEKKETKAETPEKQQAREKIFAQEFQSRAKRYLQELRRQAMIERK